MNKKISNKRYHLVVKKAIQLMELVIPLFNNNASISFEGNLCSYDFSLFEDTTQKETLNLRRNTIAPKQDFIILPLNSKAINFLTTDTFHRIGLRNKVIHIQIEYNHEIAFASYDNFHEDCVWITAEVGQSFIERLVDDKIISKYKIVENKNI